MRFLARSNMAEGITFEQFLAEHGASLFPTGHLAAGEGDGAEDEDGADEDAAMIVYRVFAHLRLDTAAWCDDLAVRSTGRGGDAAAAGCGDAPAAPAADGRSAAASVDASAATSAAAVSESASALSACTSSSGGGVPYIVARRRTAGVAKETGGGPAAKGEAGGGEEKAGRHEEERARPSVIFPVSLRWNMTFAQ